MHETLIRKDSVKISCFAVSLSLQPSPFKYCAVVTMNTKDLRTSELIPTLHDLPLHSRRTLQCDRRVVVLRRSLAPVFSKDALVSVGIKGLEKEDGFGKCEYFECPFG